ncbi:uncharacterized protein LOC141686101 [Apium graveolens]|uniref:uncharacterized protein LOC141686101 n=1 Tax=Apium graveolens TaxID=4045 RepID=UPI003D792538
MTTEIGEKILLYNTTKKIWEAAKGTFASSENTAELFQVESTLQDLRQGKNSMTIYFTILTRYWQQLDFFEVHEWKCADDRAYFKKIVETKQVFKYLMGLDKSLDEVRGRILGTKPLPNLREVFRKCIEKRAASGPGHLEETCWKLHGKPADWKPNKDREARGNVVISGASQYSTSAPFIKKQLEVLQQLMQKGNYHTQTSNSSALHSAKSSSSSWIVDSGAFDHMTGDRSFFTTYSPYTTLQTICIANGTRTKVVGTGTVCLSNTLTLNAVLFVPELDCNLIYDLSSGRMIDNDDFRVRLYVLDINTPSIHSASHQDPIELFNKVLVSTHHNKTVWLKVKNRHVLDVARSLQFQPNVPKKFLGEAILTTTYLINSNLILVHLSVSSSDIQPIKKAFVTSLDKITIPKSVYEVLKIPEWRKATLEEYNAFERNGTWVLTTLPLGKRTVGCKWIFSVKQKADRIVDRYKAPLVAKGFTQTYGIDYQETFAPVEKLNTIRVLLSLTVNKDRPLFQLDVKNAFLNGDLVEEVYMDIPCGFETEYTQGKVCKLRKTIYGLRKSSRAWFDKFAKVLICDGYSKTQADDTLFLKHFTDGRIMVLIVYVDDIVLTGNHGEEIKRLKMLLSQKFEIKDLGFLKYFLGMEVAQSSQGISVSQRKYTVDLLRETGKIGCKPVETPMDPNTKLMPRIDELADDNRRYQRLVGKLIYLTHTCPDISFDVSIVSQFLANPSVDHMEAVNRILKYLKKNPGKGLMFIKSGDQSLKVYTDADWAGSPFDRKSTSGYCSFIWGNPVTGAVKNRKWWHAVVRRLSFVF